MAFNLKKDNKDSFWHRDIKIGPLIKVKKNQNVNTPKEKVIKKVEKKSKKPTQKIEKTDPKKNKTKKGAAVKPKLGHVMLLIVRTIFFIVFGLLILSGSAVYAYKDSFSQKAFFGTKIMGEDVGGKNIAEIQAVLDRKISEIKLSFNIDSQDVSVKPEEAGLYIRTGDSAKRAILTGKGGEWYEPWLSAGASLLYKTTRIASADGLESIVAGNVPIEYHIDEAQLTSFTQSLTTKFNVESKNAGLVMNGAEIQVIPAVYGRKIVTDSIKLQIEAALRDAKSPMVKIDVEKVNPAIIEEDTKESIAAANKIMDIPVRFHYQGQNYVPERATVGGWIVFNEQDIAGIKKLIPSVDSEKVSDYLFGIGQKIAIPVVNRKVTIKNGAEQIIEQEGKDGLAVDYNNASVKAAQNMNAQKAVDMEIPTYAVKPKTHVNNILVADWSKYIEVNISTQTMCAYLAGGIKENCWSVTTGDSNHNTPVGTFLISRKSGEGGVAGGPGGGGVCMPNPPSSTPLCGINYVSTFTPQGHAIHEAWWRSSFGGQDYKWNGSHGCVNATYGIAQWIFYWAPIGTPVIIHY